MDHPSVLGAQVQQSQLRSSAVSPNVQAQGARRHLAAFAQKPVATHGMSAFAVRGQPYAAPQRLSGAEPQALQQLLTAFLMQHGFHG